MPIRLLPQMSIDLIQLKKKNTRKKRLCTTKDAGPDYGFMQLIGWYIMKNV